MLETSVTQGSDLRTSDPLDTAILHAVAYADVFDYALSSDEIHRYLDETPAALTDVLNRLAVLATGPLSEREEYYTLRGRESHVQTRRTRSQLAASLWPLAVEYAQQIARLPFVRMVAVTGALALDNVEPGADIDFLIVTRPRRVWLCRALVIQFVVKSAAKQGHLICPNYFLSEDALVIQDRNLYAARELAQMAPLYGLDIYTKMREVNGASDHAAWRNPAEAILALPVLDGLESWEMRRKQRKLMQTHDASDEAVFSPHECKGHFDRHGGNTMRALRHRMDELDSLNPAQMQDQ